MSPDETVQVRIVAVAPSMLIELGIGMSVQCWFGSGRTNSPERRIWANTARQSSNAWPTNTDSSWTSRLGSFGSIHPTQRTGEVRTTASTMACCSGLVVVSVSVTVVNG